MQTKSPLEVEQAERVASIKADIDAGTYKVDAKKLASNILIITVCKKEHNKMSIEKILQSLNKLDMLHKSLLEVAYKKTETIKIGDMDNLNQLLKDEQAHVAGIHT